MENKIKMENKKMHEISCADAQCPFHGSLSARGRSFKGIVVNKFPRRICIVFERTIYVKKYERYMKKRTKLHARLPSCLKEQVNLGDFVEIRECRPLSKIIHFVAIKKIKGENEK